MTHGGKCAHTQLALFLDIGAPAEQSARTGVTKLLRNQSVYGAPSLAATSTAFRPEFSWTELSTSLCSCVYAPPGLVQY